MLTVESTFQTPYSTFIKVIEKNTDFEKIVKDIKLFRQVRNLPYFDSELVRCTIIESQKE